MKVTFYGAVREVTGSMHLLATDTDRTLLDCGLFQGRRKETAAKNRNLPLDPQTITSIVLSHAHIDHSGRIPLLTKNHFIGRILCTRATADACKYLLMDSAHIQESDAQYLNYKTVRTFLSAMKTSKNGKKVTNRELNEIKKQLKKEGHNLNTETINEIIDLHGLDGVHPLYTSQDAENALAFFDGYPYRHPVAIGKDMTCTFYEAGHILGSAVSLIKARQNNRSLTVCYTGDLGRFDKPIIKDPVRNFEDIDRNVDLMIMESTYGDRIHEPVKDLRPQLKTVLAQTYDRGGSVIIPAFAFGRTQELLYVLHELYDGNEVPRLPIFVDSPLATNITRVFGEHPEVYDRDTHETFLKKGKNPFFFDKIHFVGSVEESMALNREEKPHIVIAASGMCEAGRVLHHLRHKIHNPRHTILIVGYMAENTLGRRLLELGTAYEQSGRNGPPPLVKFLNKEYPLKAHVVKLGGFSAHGDRIEMIRFLKESNLRIKKIAVVHGEEDQSLAFAKHLENEGFTAMVPKPGETIDIT
ncbi:MAG: MBL fold metallo-hydrolase [Desulfobacterales bacterium]|uniref:MBL fold metallo-hydrolase n=1 Tax=Candidatus Desulfatibia profunda TaxID=2841695 RepID=A0A8J6NUW3_9BACT|nr:MBL fold metallo-hydrolase [Candidatus Desulfatibia profunda]MBL7180195.1 MBL fold metallo-hydrolase [Desulfobacterales bacterium]